MSGSMNQSEYEVKYNFRASLGDTNLEDPLWKMPEKGVFTEDFVKDLVEGSADLIVHSWKDLPTLERPDTEVIATLPRADMRDVLLFRKDRLHSSRKNSRVRILTSSPRRSYNLSGFFSSYLPFENSNVEFVSVRGNIPTRLKKLLEQDVDGIIVAKAALDRLLQAPEPEFAEVQKFIRSVLAQVNFMVLPLSVNPAAAAQGALAIEISKSRSDVRDMTRRINCRDTFESVLKERKILASYGGGCHQKIGVSILKREYGEVCFLRGQTDAGETLDSVVLTPPNGIRTLPSAQGEASIFPHKGEDAAFFDREELPRRLWEQAESETYLWIARESALPATFQVAEDAIVWTAGLETWKKLARRGVWVNGSSEGLGVKEPTRIEVLVDRHVVPWVKLTHEHSHENRLGELKTCATYRLIPRERTPDLRGRTHFYWTSGTAFKRALELYPEVQKGHHSCGPGLTWTQLREVLGPSAEIGIYLDVESWRKAVLERNNE